jgi:hypothetical protein
MTQAVSPLSIVAAEGDCSAKHRPVDNKIITQHNTTKREIFI